MKSLTVLGVLGICLCFAFVSVVGAQEKLSDEVGMTASGLVYVSNKRVVDAACGDPNFRHSAYGNYEDPQEMGLDPATGFWTFQTKFRPKVGQIVTIDIELGYTDKWLAHVGVDQTWWEGHPPNAVNRHDYIVVDNTVQGYKFKGPAMAKAPWE